MQPIRIPRRSWVPPLSPLTKPTSISKLAVALLILGLWLSAAVHAQLAMELQSRRTIDTEPRRTASAIFLVTNNDDEKHDYDARLDLPDSWRVLAGVGSLEIEAKATELVIVSFFVPQGTIAHSYEVTYHVSDKDDNAVSGTSALTINVQPVVAVKAQLLEVPLHVIAGDSYKAGFLVRNDGNMPVAIKIDLESSSGLPAEIIDLNRERFNPGEARILTVHVQTDAKAGRVFHHRLALTTRVADKVAEAASEVEVIPRSGEQVDPYHRLTVELGVDQAIAFDNWWHSDAAASMEAHGTVDEHGVHRLDLTLAKSWATSVIDRYFFRVFSDSYELYTGDQSYGISPLLEQGKPARGIGGSVSLGPVGLSSYFHVSPDPATPTRTFAGSASVKNSPRGSDDGVSELAFSFLSRSDGMHGLSLRGDMAALGNVYAEGEAAAGIGSDAGSGWALRLAADGRLGWINYGSSYVYGSPDFPGLHSDTQRLQARFGLDLLRNRLKTTVSYQQDQDTSEAEQGSGYGDRDLRSRIGSKFTATGTSVLFGWNHGHRYDRASVLEQVNPENSFRFESKQLHSGGGSLGFVAEYERTQDTDASLLTHYHEYEMSLDWARIENVADNLYMIYMRETESTGSTSHAVSWGLISDIDLGIGTKLRFEFHNSNRFVLQTRDSVFDIGMSLRHMFKNGNRIEVQADASLSQRASDWRKSYSVDIGYRAPVRIPVSLKRDIGSIRGTVTDAVSEKPVSGAIIRLDGFAAVTDQRGAFRFPSLRSGTYTLNLDRPTIGLGRISLQPMPLKVVVERQKASVVDIVIVEAASVEGSVLRYRFKSEGMTFAPKREGQDEADDTGKEYVVVGGFANVLVELSDGTEVKRRLTNEKGDFAFEELRPGKWTLKVRSARIPEHHHFEQDSFVLDMRPGDRWETLIRLLPQRRRVLILEEGGTIK